MFQIKILPTHLQRYEFPDVYYDFLCYSNISNNIFVYQQGCYMPNRIEECDATTIPDELSLAKKLYYSLFPMVKIRM